MAAEIVPSAPDGIVVPGAEVDDLLFAALSELERGPGGLGRRGGVAPVLGSGVVQELLKHRPADANAPPEGIRIDKRR